MSSCHPIQSLTRPTSLSTEQISDYRKINLTRSLIHGYKSAVSQAFNGHYTTQKTDYVSLASILKIEDPDEKEQRESRFFARIFKPIFAFQTGSISFLKSLFNAIFNPKF